MPLSSALVLRRPPALHPGATVWLVAPAGHYDPAQLAAGRELLARRGLRCRGPVAMPPAPPYAGDDAQRLRALHQALADDEADAIWAVRGGTGTARLLAPVEQALARALGRRGRWLVGFSDVTALHARWAAHGWQSVHGANVVNLARWQAPAVDHLMACLGLGDTPAAEFTGEVWAGHVADGLHGRLVGGNLTVLASVVGCGVLPAWEGAVLLLEDVGEAPYRLDRALVQLREAGALRGLRAVVLGQLTRCGATEQVRRLLAATLAPLGIPVVGGLPFGHGDDSWSVVLGARAVLHARADGRVRLQVQAGVG